VAVLLSRAHRFLFLHVYKTGGSSIRDALEPYADHPGRALWQRVRARLGLPFRTRYAALGAHPRAVEVRAALPAEVFEGYYKFAFVRNPWDWQVSLYHYLLQHPEHPLHSQVSRAGDFEGFLRWRVHGDRWLQKECLADAGGHLLVNFVGRFENLRADFASVCHRIGVRARLRHLNESTHVDYRSYYTPRTRQLVAEHWREDIQFFGYRFDPGRRPRAVVLG
jgi:hypothetical protein